MGRTDSLDRQVDGQGATLNVAPKGEPDNMTMRDTIK